MVILSTSIFSTIHNRLNYHIRNNKNSYIFYLPKKEKTAQRFFTIPYVKSVSENFMPIALKMNSKLAYSIPNTLRNYIKRGKDQLDFLSQDVVYKIFYEDCDASYVGQTKRKLKTRLQVHKSDINKKTGSSTVITNHRINCNHKFNWNNVRILDNELSCNKRLISEMVHIKKQSQGLNKQNELESLHESYFPIIQSFSLF